MSHSSSSQDLEYGLSSAHAPWPPPKRPAVEHEAFVPASIKPKPPLLRLHAAEITTKGSTQLQMHYVSGNLPGRLPNDNLPFIDDWVEHAGDNGTLTEDIIDIAPVGKCKWTAADAPLLAWIPEHQSFLDEMMRLNGRGSEGITCSCGGVLPKFRCKDTT
ncbi:hypothetical protein BDR07DRAFT_1487279 [Suillus spraguei]|nr:hypothetical protein BDR07DRAFT_1487279 [Suillus spraguei]